MVRLRFVAAYLEDCKHNGRRRLYIRAPSARGLLPDRDRERRGGRLAGSGSARGAVDARDAAVGRLRRFDQDTGPSRQECSVIARSLVVLAVAAAAGAVA